MCLLVENLAASSEVDHSPVVQGFLDTFKLMEPPAKAIEAGTVIEFRDSLFGNKTQTRKLYVRHAYILVAECIFLSYGGSTDNVKDLEKKQKRAKEALRWIGYTDEQLKQVQFKKVGTYVLTGSPGTGKTTCILFIALVCYLAGIPFRVVGHHGGRAFRGFADSPDSGENTDQNEVLYLVDHDTWSFTYPMHRAIFTSPDPERLSKLSQLSLTKRMYMDVWSLDELQDWAKKCSGPSADRINTLYDKFGGIIRYVMKQPEEDEEFDSWLQNLIQEAIHQRIENIQDLPGVLNALVVDEKTPRGPRSFVLVHIRTQNEKGIGLLSETTEQCGSDYIRDELAKKMDRILDDAQLEVFFALEGGDGKAASLKGQLFQPIVQKRLCRQWASEANMICYLGSKSPAPRKTLGLDKGERTAVECSTRDEIIEQLKDGDHNLVVVPLDESFPLGDFLRPSPPRLGFDYDIFQSTVSNKHPPTQKGLEEVEKTLPKRNGRDVTAIRLFFCVPPVRFKAPNSTLSRQQHKMAEQPIQVSNDDKRRADCPDGITLEQFALEIRTSWVGGQDEPGENSDGDLPASATATRE